MTLILSAQVLRNAFDQAEAELDSCALDLTRSGTTAVLSIVTHDWWAVLPHTVFQVCL